MDYNYSTIKQRAKVEGRTIDDYLALSSQHDPFYVGTPTDIAKAEWFADIYRRAGYSGDNAPHLRRVHYWTVSQETPVMMPNRKPYENTDKCWEYLLESSSAARYLGLVPFTGIRDNKNPDAKQRAIYNHDPLAAYSTVPDLDAIKPEIEGVSIENAQPYHLEIWCEKSTMNDVLMPICERYSANLVTFEGEVSITSVCVNLMSRIADSGYKPTRIWFISDFDPAGNSIPLAMSRKLEYALWNCTPRVDTKVSVLALNAEQVKRYRLPRTPIKTTEKRAGKFEQAFGAGAVELDALEALYPKELARIVDDAISPFYSTEAENAVVRAYRALESAVKAKTDAIRTKYAAQIDALRPMLDELAAIDIDPTPHSVKRFAPHVSEDDDSLFDSGRGYDEQIARYKQHKGA